MIDVQDNNATNVQLYDETISLTDATTVTTITGCSFDFRHILNPHAFVEDAKRRYPMAEATEVLIQFPSGEYRYTWADFLARLGIKE